MRLIGYTRVSDKEQDKKGYSIESQTESIELWCTENNHNLVKIYSEIKTSSKPSQHHRPEFERAVKITLAGGADGLVIKWIDRFARNVEDFLRVRSQLYTKGKHLISISEPMLNGDPGDPIVRFISTAIMNAYQLQAELSGLKAAQGRQRRAAQGNYPGSIPMGYTRKNREITINHQYAEIIKIAYKEFSTNQYTLAKWTIEAKKRGYRNQRGNLVSLSGWQRILRNQFYIGQYEWAGKQFQGNHPQFIPITTFNQVQEVLNNHSTGSSERKHNFLLSGLLWSQVHHKTMTGIIAKKKYHYYRATAPGEPDHTIPAQDLENRVLEMLNSIQFIGNIYQMPDEWRLALKMAETMGEIYPHLTRQEQQRFLRIIFLKRGIHIEPSGRINKIDLFSNFSKV
jgi:DNA invertase Pin-like site-specific DNA recombinase